MVGVLLTSATHICHIQYTQNQPENPFFGPLDRSSHQSSPCLYDTSEQMKDLARDWKDIGISMALEKVSPRGYCSVAQCTHILYIGTFVRMYLCMLLL